MCGELFFALWLLSEESMDQTAGSVERGIRASRGPQGLDYYINVWGSEIKAKQMQKIAVEEMKRGH